MSGLRFCMLTTFYPPHNFGGDGIAIQRLSRALVRRGHEVVVVHDVDAYNALRRGPPPRRDESDDGVQVIGLRSGLQMLSPLLTHQFGRPVMNGGRINEILQRGDFDVTMFHNISLVGSAGLLAAGRGVTLYEAHEHWLVCPMHVLWRHDREACAGRECLRCVLRSHRPPQVWRYTDHLERQLGNVDAFIAKSEFSRDKHAEFGFTRSMHVIPYFLPDSCVRLPPLVAAEALETSSGDADAASVVSADAASVVTTDAASVVTADAVSPHARPYFLYVGRLEKIKGLDDVIPVFHDYPRADLLIAGEGTHGPVLRRLAAGLPNVRFLGRLPTDDLRRYYEHALALVVPSIGYETFGIIIIEAMREGTPVIARRIGPFPEMIEASGGGLVFDGPQDLLLRLNEIQQDASLRLALGRAGERAFRQYWTEEMVVPRYLELIREVAKRKSLTRIVEQLVESAA